MVWRTTPGASALPPFFCSHVKLILIKKETSTVASFVLYTCVCVCVVAGLQEHLLDCTVEPRTAIPTCKDTSVPLRLPGRVRRLIMSCCSRHKDRQEVIV